jgi:hypothetical protein
VQGQASNDSREAQVIGTNHQADDNHNEPLVGGLPGKVGSKNGQDFVYIFQHGLVDREEIG